MFEVVEREIIRAKTIQTYNDELRAFREIIEEAKQKREEFLADDLTNLKEKDFAAFFVKIIEYYTELALFPDKVIIAKLEALGIKGEALKWFIALSEIEKMLQHLKEEFKIQYQLYGIVFGLKMHLTLKIVNEIQLSFPELNYENRREKTSIIHYLINRNFRNNARPSKRIIKEDSIKAELNKIVDKMQNIHGGHSKAKKFVRSVFQGKTDNLIIRDIILNGLYPAPNMSETKFFNSIYDFIRFITKHPKMKNEIEFYESKGYITIERYRHKTMKSLFLRGIKFRPNLVHFI